MDPTVEQLLIRRAAAGFPTLAQRRQSLPIPIRGLHRRVVGYFAVTGQPPPPATLAAWVAELGVGLQDGLGRLVEADLVEADPASGELAGAYPFVASPRGQQVDLSGGLTVQAYCAVDALGIPAMLDQDATITSRDPLTGVPITVEVRDGRAHPMPTGVVVGYVIDHQGAAGAGPAGAAGQAACCRCPLINFHASPATAHTWQERQGLRLELLAIPQALQLAATAFASLLRSQDSADLDPTDPTATRTIAGRGGRPDDQPTP